MTIFFQDYARWLLVLHALSAVVLLGTTAHLAWRALSGTLPLRGAQTSWMVWSYIVTFVSGVLIYPTYRYYVRALYFEPQMKSVNFYFEVKEHLAALGLVVLLACWAALPNGAEPVVSRFRRVAAVALFLVVAYGYVVSIVLNNLKGI